MTPVVVVAAVIERDGAFLLTLRPEGTHLAGRWEFPGGKVHVSETHAEALRRELFEELDIVAEVGGGAYGDAPIRKIVGCTSTGAAFTAKRSRWWGRRCDGAARRPATLSFPE
jgi:8-oxo-dGTP pyrophosphatase MutT (NUDIX family)